MQVKPTHKPTPSLIAVKPNRDPSRYPHSHSRITNILTCPTFGCVHNQRQYPSTSRILPLEAGGAMHEVFAAIRCWQLEHVQKLKRHALVTAERVLGLARWRNCVSHTKDKRDNLIELCFNILHTTGYQDDEGDKVRTMSNMELAIINYVDERLPFMENWPIWMADKRDPYAPVGVEQIFDVELHYSDKLILRYIGTIDGLVLNLARDGRAEIDENKTAYRLDEGWRMSFDMSMQITGYCACSTTVFGFPVLHSRTTGLMIRPTRQGDAVQPIEPLVRDAVSIQHWGAWVRHGAELFSRYADDFEHAPRYTHACNRYFRPCVLIPFCCDTPDGRAQQFESMVPADLSPSERAVLEREEEKREEKRR